MSLLNVGSNYHVWSQPSRGALPRISAVPFWPRPLVSLYVIEFGSHPSSWASQLYRKAWALGAFLSLNEFAFWRKVCPSATPSRHYKGLTQPSSEISLVGCWKRRTSTLFSHSALQIVAFLTWPASTHSASRSCVAASSQAECSMMKAKP